MKALVISSSPRKDGNSYLLAQSAHKGLKDAGIDSEIVYLSDYITDFLHDCKAHEKVNGECVFEDNYKELFVEKFLPADGVIFATPLYWYSMSAQLKAFFDRTFCYFSGTHPQLESYIKQCCGKQLGLIISSEETYPMSGVGIIQPIQEFSRYTHSNFVGYVQGIGNSRGDVNKDPLDPISKAYQLGLTLFNRKSSDYKIDTPRDNSVW
ncbi:flavodoxin family protein [Akkermansiaceae bacterium]|nr:flavodoxin family protein [Akkermansiaceae bacterium]